MDNPLIVGEPVQVLMWYPTTLVKCNCKGKQHLNLIIVTGFNNAASCGHCGKMFRVKGLDGTEIQVDVIVPTPKSAVQ